MKLNRIIGAVLIQRGGDVLDADIPDQVLGTIGASPTQEVERILSNLVAGFCGSGSSYKPAGGH
jgi:hypothetical protein